MSLRLGLAVLCFVLLVTAGCNGVRVRKGDTLYSIAGRNDIPMRAIIEENKLKPPYTLSVGQYLKLPKIQTHRVRKSDTLYSIAKKYGMSVSSLAKINHLKAPYTIRHGEVLRISSWDEAGQQTIFDETDRYAGGGSVAGDRKQEAERRKKVKDPTAFRGKATVPKSQTGKKFDWPIVGKIVSDFGPGNDGINIAGKAGATVKAAEAGTVAYAGSELKGYGNLVLIKHSDGWITAYAHNQKLSVKKGDKVKRGQKIAEVGSTGSVRSAQLHFEVRYKAKVVNPNHYLKSNAKKVLQ